MDATPTLAPELDPAEDARTIGRKGARMPQVEIITRGDRRRVWTLEQKREIVAESLGVGADAGGSGAQARHQQRPAVWLATEAAQWPEDAFAAAAAQLCPGRDRTDAL